VVSDLTLRSAAGAESLAQPRIFTGCTVRDSFSIPPMLGSRLS